MDRGNWLTAARVARLPAVLRGIRGQPPPGIPVDRAVRVLWRPCGGPLDELPSLLEVLDVAQLIQRGSSLRLTKAGHQIATQDHQQGGRLLARALIGAGIYAEQARRLVESGAVEEGTGRLIWDRRLAVDLAPQLVGLLRRFPDVVWADAFSVPAALAAELGEPWALLPAPAKPELDLRKEVGTRGELYTYRLERLMAAESSRIRWVARDDEGLGYDIEDVTAVPSRKIEVKASTVEDVRFYLSANEWSRAEENADRYEVQFWGGVNLSRAPAEDFAALRAAGYPIIFRDLQTRVDAGDLSIRCIEYLLEATPHRDLGATPQRDHE